MNTYHAFYNQKRKEVFATTAYAAQLQAVEIFKPPKSKKHMVHVVLVAVENRPVTHPTSSI